MTQRKAEARSASLETDAPLIDPALDTLDRRPFAEGVVRAIKAAPLNDGFVIGIHGPWGDGKTSVLNFISAELAGVGISCRTFNPWRLGDETQLLVEFFAEVAKALAHRKQLVRSQIVRLAEAMGEVGEILDQRLGKAATAVAKQAQRSLEDTRADLHAHLRKTGARHVVLIDDIDRLNKDELFTLFRIIKATADLPGVVYLLAFDDTAVADALQERFGGQDTCAGRKFLEKIIQMPLALPPAAPAALERTFRRGLDHVQADLGIAAIWHPDKLRFDALFDRGIRPALHTPRQVKQCLNAIRFALAALSNEANPVDVILVEGLRCLYPPVHAIVRRHHNLLCGGGRHVETDLDPSKFEGKLWDGTITSLRVLERQAVEDLLGGLFPRLAPTADDSSISPVEVALWAKQKRVCAPAYCARYFTYAVADSALSEPAVVAIVHEARRIDSRILAANIGEALDPVRQRSSVTKIRAAIATLEPGAAIRLAEAVSACSSSFEEPFSLELEASFGREASDLVRSLWLRSSNEQSLLNSVAHVIQTTPAVWFAAAVWMQLQPVASSDGTQRLVSANVLGAANRALAERIEEEHKLGLTFLTLERRWRFEVLRIWARIAGISKTTPLFVPQMQQNLGIAMELLMCLTQPVSDSSPDEVPQPIDLKWEHIEKLKAIIDVPMMARILEDTWGSHVAAKPETWPSMHIRDRLIPQFAQMVARGKPASVDSGGGRGGTR